MYIHEGMYFHYQCLEATYHTHPYALMGLAPQALVAASNAALPYAGAHGVLAPQRPLSRRRGLRGIGTIHRRKRGGHIVIA